MYRLRRTPNYCPLLFQTSQSADMSPSCRCCKHYRVGEKNVHFSGIGIRLDRGQKFQSFCTISHSLLANFLVCVAPAGSFSCYKIFLLEFTLMVCNEHSYKVIMASICALIGLLFHRTQMHEGPLKALSLNGRQRTWKYHTDATSLSSADF